MEDNFEFFDTNEDISSAFGAAPATEETKEEEKAPSPKPAGKPQESSEEDSFKIIDAYDDDIFKPIEKQKATTEPAKDADKEGEQPALSDTEKESNKKIYSYLVENNLIVPDEGFEYDGSDEAIQEVANKTLEYYQQQAVQSLLEKVPEDLAEVLKYAISGGTDYVELLTTKEPNFDYSTEDGRKDAIVYYYKNVMNWNNDKIGKYINKLDTEEIEGEANDVKVEMTKYYEDQKAERLAAQQQAEQAAIKAAKDHRDLLSNTVDKINYIKDDRKGKVKAFISNPIKKQDGVRTEFSRIVQAIQSNPEHYIQLADLLMDYDKEKGLNYDRIERRAGTRLSHAMNSKITKDTQEKVQKANFDWAKIFSGNK